MSSVLYDFPGPKAKRLDRSLNIGFSAVLLGLVGYGIYSLYTRGIFDERWAVLWSPPKGQTAGDVWGSMFEGLWATLTAAALATPAALLLGVGLAVVRRGVRNPLVRGGSIVVTELYRGLPVLFNMFLAKLVFGWSPLWSVFYGLVVYNLAVVAEILRAGLAALPKGQREAGLSIGLSPMRTTLLIELPQAVRIMLPALMSQLVVLLKDTSLGYIIAYPELLRTIKLNRDYFGADYMLPLFIVGAAMYIAINLAITRLATLLERRLREGRRGMRPPETGPAGPIPQSGLGGPAREEGAAAGDPLFGHRSAVSRGLPARRPGETDDEFRRRVGEVDWRSAQLKSNTDFGGGGAS